MGEKWKMQEKFTCNKIKIDFVSTRERHATHPPSLFENHYLKKNLINLILQLYDRNKSCHKCHYKQHWFPLSTFQDALFSLQESPKFSRFQKFKDYSYFQWHRSYIVLVEIKVCRNYFINNFKLHDQLSRIHSFHSMMMSLWSWQNSAISQKKSFFGQL